MRGATAGLDVMLSVDHTVQTTGLPGEDQGSRLRPTLTVSRVGACLGSAWKPRQSQTPAP